MTPAGSQKVAPGRRPGVEPPYTTDPSGVADVYNEESHPLEYQAPAPRGVDNSHRHRLRLSLQTPASADPVLTQNTY